MYADENVIKIKHDVLYEVAKLAFADELEEKRDGIAEALIQDQHRNSVAVFIKRERSFAREFA